MNPYLNHSLSDLITIIANNSYLKETGIKEVSEIAADKIKTEREGVFLVRSLRKAKHFDEADNLHVTLKLKYPSSEALKSEALWLLFSSKVCDGNNRDYIKDSRYILNETSQTDQKTKLIYEITALLTLSRLIRDVRYAEAYKLTSKLNPLVLSDKGRKAKNGIYYPSNKQQFYDYKAKSLIGLQKVRPYINWVFEKANFVQQKREEFLEFVISSCTYTRYDQTTFISESVLGNFLFQFDVDLTHKHSVLPPKTTNSNTILLSELGQYLFCPASYSLNKTFNMPKQKPMDNSSKWTGNKDGFYDRFIKYKRGENFESCFDYPSFENTRERISIIKEHNVLEVFKELFDGNIIVNNYYDTSLKTFICDDGKITGAPDYILKLANGKNVVIAEKFSSISSTGAEKVYNSDIIDLEAYLLKFKKLNINYAYLINWNWAIYREKNENGPDIKNLYISKVNVHKIEPDQARESLINQTIEKIEILNKNSELTYTNLGFANKCLNCSVYTYCEHKKGVIKKVNVPYSPKE